MNEKATRTRFAPSPTGELHLGGARTALFNLLLAKKEKGVSVLRIEDTDFERSKDYFLKGLYEDLLWLGLQFQESFLNGGDYGPYKQSERINIYKKFIEELIAKKKAYYCFCTKEELSKEKEEFLNKEKKKNYSYSRKCLYLSKLKIKELIEKKKPYVIRFKVNNEKDFFLKDLLRGEIIFRGKDIEDFVISRHNGVPLLNFVVVIDDHLMKITHVLRGEDHLTNTAKQIALYESFDWAPPFFIHLPLIFSKENEKISKRKNSENKFESIKNLRSLGFLPQAVLNYLLFLGWNPKNNKELFTFEEAAKCFEIKDIHLRRAIFSIEKLKWFNNQYIQKISDEEYLEKSINFLIKSFPQVRENQTRAEEIALLFRKQINYFFELVELSSFFFQKPIINKEKFQTEDKLLIEKIKKNFSLMKEEWNLKSIKDLLNKIEKKDYHLIRRIISGKEKGPEIFKIIYFLGKEEFLDRINLNNKE